MKRALQGTLRHFTAKLFLMQWLGNIAILVLAGLWLQLPDSHIWQLGFSLLSGLLIVACFFALYTVTFRLLRTSDVRPPWWYSSLVLAGLLLLCWLGLQVLDYGRAHEALYAGYLNSQSPHWLRAHLGYSSIVAWQDRFYDVLQWLGIGLLIPMAIVHCAAKGRGKTGQATSHPYTHGLYWLTVLVCGIGGSALTWALAEWTPEAGLLGQTVSVALRLGLAYTVDMLLWCFLLAMAAHYLDDPA